MEIIAPLPASLTRTSGGSPTFLSPAWASGQVYPARTVVRSNASGAWRDYWAIFQHTSQSWNAPPLAWFWIDLGPSASTGGYTWSTNVQLSNAPDWTTGAIAEGEVRFDPADLHDYRALIAMTSPENAQRPSQATQSRDPIVRARWLDLGAANAWAPLDHKTNSYLNGYNTSGAIMSSVVFSVDVETTSACDRVCFAGLINVSSVQIKTYLAGSGTAAQTITQSMVPSGTSFGITFRSLIIPITSVSAGTALKVEVTLTRHAAGSPARLGVLAFGQARELSWTHWGTETSLLGFSTKERNDTFGTAKLIKRGSAKLVRATCFVDPAIVSGDVIQQVLADYDGIPVYYDFNGHGTSFDRLRVFGFYSRMSMAIKAHTFESLSLDVEGLVE